MRTMHTVRSLDGTPIAFERRGHGPPLVMVHGSSLDHTRWGPRVGRLAEHFTLMMMDRRGRGLSGDGPAYSIEREFEDVAAVVNAAEMPAYLLAHSFGAICSLEASRLTRNLAKMVLYEPPLPLGNRPNLFGPDMPDRLEALLRRGDRDSLLQVFFREVVQVSEGELTALRRSSSWPLRLEITPTLPREVRVAEDYRFDPSRFRDVLVPTLFLLGTESPAYMRDATMAAHAALAGGQVELIRGEGHSAMTTAPDVFLEKLLRFLAP